MASYGKLMVNGEVVSNVIRSFLTIRNCGALLPTQDAVPQYLLEAAVLKAYKPEIVNKYTISLMGIKYINTLLIYLTLSGR